RLGFTPAQKKYIAKVLEDYAKDYPANAPYGADSIDIIRKDGKLVEQPRSRDPKNLIGSKRATEIDRETIIVPDDGTFTVTDMQQANRLYQRITGKNLPKQPREKLSSVEPVDKIQQVVNRGTQ